jgi:hypothetical protein
LQKRLPQKKQAHVMDVMDVQQKNNLKPTKLKSNTCIYIVIVQKARQQLQLSDDS